MQNVLDVTTERCLREKIPFDVDATHEMALNVAASNIAAKFSSDDHKEFVEHGRSLVGKPTCKVVMRDSGEICKFVNLIVALISNTFFSQYYFYIIIKEKPPNQQQQLEKV